MPLGTSTSWVSHKHKMLDKVPSRFGTELSPRRLEPLSYWDDIQLGVFVNLCTSLFLFLRTFTALVS